MGTFRRTKRCRSEDANKTITNLQRATDYKSPNPILLELLIGICYGAGYFRKSIDKWGTFCRPPADFNNKKIFFLIKNSF
jgi:hypothetical protein